MMSGFFFPPGGKEKWGSGWLVCDDWARGGNWDLHIWCGIFQTGLWQKGGEDFS